MRGGWGGVLGTDLQQQRDEGFNLQDLGSLLHQDVVKLHRHKHTHKCIHINAYT